MSAANNSRNKAEQCEHTWFDVENYQRSNYSRCLSCQARIYIEPWRSPLCERCNRHPGTHAGTPTKQVVD